MEFPLAAAVVLSKMYKDDVLDSTFQKRGVTPDQQDAQAEGYSEELDALKKGKDVPKRSYINKLTPFLDQENIIRVGGRLEKAQLPYDTKHPAILPKGHPVSQLIVSHVHRRGNHSRGVNCVFAELRQKYWVVNGREEVKRSERECNLCKIRRKRTGQQIMAPLPKARLRVSMRCFARRCVDYAGPLVTKLTRRVTAKRYLCLFTCAATRAVHLEIAYSLDTDSFLNALSRMIARRGKPEEMISDNGTNFTAADNELRQLVAELDQQKITDKATNEWIKWRFNPPTGSHHGGVFEALIKSAKSSLKPILGNAGITDEELHTAIVEVEGLMNARPLTYPSNDPSDEPSLTPNHFINGQAGGELAPQGTEELAFNLRKRWRFIQDLTAQAWRR
ncbi:uncharacterized protein LOC116293341 [Actinia tenebrosa]|uniref:Uncharacterized protein LOC116293341 n=1 Tax=Actinia tenebrosa TaxID=6105 RepID=A0A6P8HNN1_ACTTE|nr:uncharacterized protein LOC116293341 [Actinia tenebrosa]